MPTDAQISTALRFSADPRLAAAAAGVARYFADSAGMEADAVAKLQAATLAICVEEFPHLAADDSKLSVDVSRFADRIEIVVTCTGEPGRRVSSIPGVDKIETTTYGDESTTRLTKFIAQS